MSFDTHVIRSDNSAVGINPKGGYVSSWTVKHPQTGELTDILYQGKTLKRTGIPILFPQFQEARGLPKHGFARESVWTVGKAEPSRITMTLTDGDLSPEIRAGYPYQFTTEISVEIAADTSFVYTLSVKNLGEEALPVAPGLHPYWAIDQNDKMKLMIDGLTQFDATLFDWVTNPPDTPYPYEGKTVINMPDRKISIEDITPGGPVIKHIVVWSQMPTMDDYNFVCVEPICGYSGALDTQPIRITGGSEWRMEIRFAVSFVDAP